MATLFTLFFKILMVLLFLSIVLIAWMVEMMYGSGHIHTKKKLRTIREIIRRDGDIPIMKKVLYDGMLNVSELDATSGYTCFGIARKYKVSLYKNPELFYIIAKKELCGDLSDNWQQALKEANTLRLGNLSR